MENGNWTTAAEGSRAEIPMAKSYVRTDEHEVLRVGHTKVMLDSVLASFEKGHSPETIQQEYPAQSLEEVYGSIAYYLSNPKEVQAYLRRQGKLWDEWRAKASELPSPVGQRLRSLRGADISDEK